MSRLDIVIFGATGFTGRKAVAELARMAKKQNLTWGIGGRSKKKLDDVLLEAGKSTGEDLSKIKTLIADTSDMASLKAMCAQAQVVANCCGPYRHYGEPVIQACIETKTHHLDISGEPQFIETMQLKYNAAARAAGVFVVSACGFDSIPNDMGVVFLQQNFGGTVNSVESYLESHVPPALQRAAVVSGSVNFGTWESAVYGLAHWDELKPLRKQLYPEPMPAFKPKLKPRSLIHRFQSYYAIPFPGADNSLVYRSQRHLYEASAAQQRPAQFRAYVKFAELYRAVLLILVGVTMMLLTRFKLGTWLLLNFPRVFSLGLVTKQGPPDEVSNNTTFEFLLVGRGWASGAAEGTPPNKEVLVKVRGVNPGYGATVTALLWSAVTALREAASMPPPGVLTTAVAFGKTNLIKNLNENNLTFEVVESKMIA